jgi:hypothetical protein
MRQEISSGPLEAHKASERLETCCGLLRKTTQSRSRRRNCNSEACNSQPCSKETADTVICANEAGTKKTEGLLRLYYTVQFCFKHHCKDKNSSTMFKSLQICTQYKLKTNRRRIYRMFHLKRNPNNNHLQQ